MLCGGPGDGMDSRLHRHTAFLSTAALDDKMRVARCQPSRPERRRLRDDDGISCCRCTAKEDEGAQRASYEAA